ncbi:MAG: FAD-dependent thymidylate synthase [Syntrophobacteraceae bacterium]
MCVQFVKSAVFPFGPAPSDELRALRLIEVCGRTAYKSEDKITETSAKSFVLMLKSHGHLSVLEHSNIVIRVEPKEEAAISTMGRLLAFDSVLKTLKDRLGFHRIFPLNPDGASGFILAGNFRAWLETVEYLKECEPLAHRFFTATLNRSFPNLFEPAAESIDKIPFRAFIVPEEDQIRFLKADQALDLPVFVFRFVCDRGITHEVVRHRVLSFTQESTRYVNYKNRGMVLILPEELHPFFDDSRSDFAEDAPAVREWKKRAELIFDWYREDVARGLRPEIARDILPNLLKSEILVSGRFSGWRHFIGLRESSAAHPRIRFLAREVRTYFEQLGLSCG